jgi:phospholipase A1/A2
MRALALLLPALLLATPAAAQLRAVPAQPASEEAALRGVEVFLVNEGATPLADGGPRQLEVTAVDGTRLVLERTPGPVPTIAPGGFAKARYVPVGIAGRAEPPVATAAATLGEGESVIRSSTGSSAAFLSRFMPHEPIYGVAGLDDAGAKLQVSFAFRPFAEDAPLRLGNLRFAYTQTMFWAINQDSGPFRATNYSPEVYADLPLDETAGVAIGYRHDSNGRGVTGSVDVNRLFLRVEKRFDLGGDWSLDVAPQAWLFVGQRALRREPERAFGHAGFNLALGQQDGVKLAVTARGNVDTGRGAAEAFLSYPLARLGGGLGIYLFGQAFTGYGEALDDLTLNTRHARLGIALTR